MAGAIRRGQLQAYPRTAAAGQTVFDGDDAKARAEITAVTDELLTAINGEAQ
ncbi:MAG: hypothetical protein OXI73_13715 [Rhodospirillales bacterium]|nr:hypothetical protein [Rhodospirillales bacterium]